MRYVCHLSVNGNCNVVIIAKAAMRELGWSPKEDVAVFVENGRLIVASLKGEIDRQHRAAAEVAAHLDAVVTP